MLNLSPAKTGLCRLSVTGNSSGLAHLQDGARVWCVLWKPLRLWCSWKSPGCMWILQPGPKRDGMWPVPHGVRPSHDAGCNATAGARGPALLALHTYLHIPPGNHLTDRYQPEQKGSVIMQLLCWFVFQILSFNSFWFIFSLCQM